MHGATIKTREGCFFFDGNTYLMEQSPWEAKRFSASQEIRRILRHPNVYNRLYKSPPPVRFLRR